jgi:predicted DNA-binding transcriptional regulator AlpA
MRHLEKNSETVAASPRLLTKAEVLALLRLTSYTTVFTWMREGQFPLSIELGPPGGRSTKIAWLADEVYAWIASRPRRKLTPTPIKPSTPSHTLQASRIRTGLSNTRSSPSGSVQHEQS